MAFEIMFTKIIYNKNFKIDLKKKFKKLLLILNFLLKFFINIFY